MGARLRANWPEKVIRCPVIGCKGGTHMDSVPHGATVGGCLDEYTPRFRCLECNIHFEVLNPRSFSSPEG